MQSWRESIRKLDLPPQWGHALIPGALGAAVMTFSALDTRGDLSATGRPAGFTVGALLVTAALALFLPSFLRIALRRPAAGAFGAVLLLVFVGLPVGLAAWRGIIPGLRRHPAVEPLAPVALRLDRDRIFAGDQVEVLFDPAIRVPDGCRPFVAVARPGASTGDFSNMTVVLADATGVHIQVPDTPGAWEFRLYSSPQSVVATLPFETAIRPLLTPEAPVAEPPPVERR